ncbi:MAG: Membrane fusion protein multidrug efflux system [Verrucomicrobia bacterium]|nr:Membrane fusion protein multidrug efflux system [Verrucomicrobiota bacterium]
MKTAADAPAPSLAAPLSVEKPAAPAKAKSIPSSRNRYLGRATLAVIAVAVLLWGGRAGLHTYRYVETDNAYVVGHFHQVSPQLDGQVKEVLVQDNQVVKAGDPLVRLDTQEFEIGVEKARAAVAQAEAQDKETIAALAQSRAGQAEARAKVAQAAAQVAQTQAQLDLAQLTLGRNEQLFRNSGSTTQAELDNAKAAADAALANFHAANANRDAAQAAVDSAAASFAATEAQVTAAKANVAAAQAALSDAQRKLAYTTITAPNDGRIGNKSVEPGNRVLAGQTLLALVEPNVWIVANFKETQLPRMHVGQEVELAVDALPGLKLLGKIDSLAPASGALFALLPPDNATGNFNKVVQRIPVKILLASDSQEAASLLRVGYSVVVNVRVR